MESLRRQRRGARRRSQRRFPREPRTGSVVVTVGGQASNGSTFTRNARAEHREPCAKYGRGRFGSNDQRIELWFDAGQWRSEVRHAGSNHFQLEFDEHCGNGSDRSCNGKRGRDSGRRRGQQWKHVHGDFSASDYQRGSCGWRRIWIVVHDYGDAISVLRRAMAK